MLQKYLHPSNVLANKLSICADLVRQLIQFNVSREGLYHISHKIFLPFVMKLEYL